jgi:hypothetical protein
MSKGNVTKQMLLCRFCISDAILLGPCSFVPFIVVFCHVMETRDHADLARLEAFVNSIHAATTVSEPAAKMYRLFQVLHNIATRYLELGGTGDNQGKQSSVPSMDTQLAALGLPHAEHWEMNNAPTDFRWRAGESSMR